MGLLRTGPLTRRVHGRMIIGHNPLICYLRDVSVRNKRGVSGILVPTSVQLAPGGVAVRNDPVITLSNATHLISRMS